MLKVELLTGNHQRKLFDCGDEILNRWLWEQAWQSQKKGLSRTFVAVMDNDPTVIFGFYALNSAEVFCEQLPAKVGHKMPHRIPVFRLGRLAVGRDGHGKGLGGILLVNAIERALHAAEHIASVGLLVEAKNTGLLEFYRKFGFLDCLDNPLRLFLPFRNFHYDG